MTDFYYLSDLGEISLPDKQEIEEINSNGNGELLLLLDSCVCMDIVTFVKHKKKARVDKQKIFSLIEYVQMNNIDFTPIFALIELSYNRITLEMTDEKMWDFKNKIDFAFSFPIKLLKRYDFDYDVNYILSGQTNPSMDSIHPLTPNLLRSYASLLKIREIACRGLKKEHAEKNIKYFIDWMIDELDTFMGLEYALALEVFGGNTKLGSMLRIGSSFENTKKAIWGSTWDLFHARLSCNREQLQNLIGRKVQPVFVTKDYSLYKLLSPHVEHKVRFNNTKISITTNNEYPKHFSNTFMEEMNEKILSLSVDRVGLDRYIDLNKINGFIDELEVKLSSQISQ